MNEENKSIFVTRLIALGWHVGTMVAAVLIDFAVTNLHLFSLPDWMTVILGLVFAQITKYLNTPKG
jgi:hypothetical protein